MIFVPLSIGLGEVGHSLLICTHMVLLALKCDWGRP